MDDYAKIRLAHRDGMSIREIARRYHHSRRKIREVLRNAEPRGYTRKKAVRAPKLGSFHGQIDEILKADESAPRKQQHTAAQIFRRLRDEFGYTGGYDQVRRYVAKGRRKEAETFLPLDHSAGQRMEADFGHIHVDFPDGRRRVNVLLLTWAHSYRAFAIALPTQRVEAILHGMVAAFEHFGCVPRELWWDNPTTVAREILLGRERVLHARYQALASHYNFSPLFCMPARGNEKPHVENRVKNLQRRWATPVPTVNDLTELNAHLLRCMEEDLTRIASGQQETIGCRFQQDREAALSLPDHRFDDCIREERKVDKYQTVAFDNNRYSVPRSFAFHAAVVKGYVHHVDIIVADQLVARHQRHYGKAEHILKPEHYLSVLGRKPAYLDHTRVFKDWKLPAIFNELREHLETRHGAYAGSRSFIRVLQSLARHPLNRVRHAVESCRPDRWTADSILARVEQLAVCQAEETAAQDADSLNGSEHVPHVHVPEPNLNTFDQLLLTGG